MKRVREFAASVALACVSVVVIDGWWANPVIAAPLTVGGPSTDCPDLDFASFDIPPSLESAEPVLYPWLASISGMKGDVVVSVRVLADGTACDAEVVDGTHALIDREARKAALDSTYMPATLHSEPVPGFIEVVYTFDQKFCSVDDPDLELVRLLGPPPYVRDVAQLIEAATGNGEEPPVYELGGVRFRGDLSVELFRSVVDQIQDYLQDAEEPHTVSSYLYMSSVANIGLEYRPEILVKTCTGRHPDGRCEKGRIFRFVWDGEVFELKSNNWSWNN